MDDVSYSFYSIVQTFFENVYYNSPNPYSNKLFIDLSISDFFLPYIMIIVSYRVKKIEVGVRMYEIIFRKKYNAPEWHLKNLVHNIRFFVDSFTEYTHKLLEEYKVSCSLFKEIYENQNKSK
jgi:hypothetical protein